MFYLSPKINIYKKHFSLISLLLIISGCASKSVHDFEPPVYPPPPDEPRFIWERTLRHSGDISEESFGDKFKYLITGQSKSSLGLAKPYGVAVNKGRVYVTDTVQRALLVFDVPNSEYKVLGTEGPGALAKPIGIDIVNDEIYVVDNTAQRVVVFDLDGNYRRAIGGSVYLRRPSGIAVSPDGQTAYVVDTGGVDTQEHHRVVIFNAQTGKFIRYLGTRGTEPGNFNLPLQAAASPDGTLYVVDGGNFRVQGFDTKDYSPKMSIGNIGVRAGQFARPKGVATDKNGNIYVIDTSFSNFQIFSPQGELLLFVGSRGPDVPGRYVLLAGIDVDEDGRIYVVDQYYNKIDVFRPASMDKDTGYLVKKKVN